MLISLVMLIFISHVDNVYSFRYDNYSLYTVIPYIRKHVHFLKNLTATIPSINFWRYPGHVNASVEFSIAPEHKEVFVEKANLHGLKFKTIINNIQSAFDKQHVETYTRRKLNTFDWKHFYKLNDIYNWLIDLSDKYPNETELIYLGKTYENRNILGLRIKLKKDTRSTVVIEGGIHAREWIAPAVVTYLINAILGTNTNELNTNNSLKSIARTYDWYFIPVLNPDGYDYTHNVDRMWRKNRQPYKGGVGVDLNRNFPSYFGKTGVSKDVSSEIFCGPKPFSELETKAMSKLLNSLSSNLEYYVGFHSYGQHLIIPYAYSRKHLENYKEVETICEKVVDNIRKKYGRVYTIGTAHDTVGYTTSGVSGCWVKKQFRVPYVVTFELRDTGTNGFALPPSEILHTSEEILNGLISFFTPRSKAFTRLKGQRQIEPNASARLLFNVISFVFIIILFCI